MRNTTIIGESPSILEIRSMIEKISRSDVPVFIRGESGTGKELVAKEIHQKSQRCGGRFVAVNCGALPENLLESELFGHARGAFTGAYRDKPGLIEEAGGGTFFLDEIGDLSPHLQAKFLRFLQEKEVRRVGDNHVRRVDVRLISATHKDIDEEVKSNQFRQDLYYRLKILTIEIPPLSKRKEDITMLIHHFLDLYSGQTGKEKIEFSPQAMELLVAYDWPGNVRELQNEIQKCLVLADGMKSISAEYLSSRIKPEKENRSVLTYDFSKARADFEKRFIRQALRQSNFHRGATAQKMGLSRQGLFKLMKKYNITVPDSKADFS